jgi:hypothetical protein
MKGDTIMMRDTINNETMRIEDFTMEHIDFAMKIVLDNYNKEREYVPELPAFEAMPEWLLPQYKHFATNGLGVAMMENDVMIGFLCFYEPIEDAFASTGVRGTFSPIHGNGVKSSISGQKRERIYSILYQAAAKKLTDQGIRSHAVAILKHDIDAERSFFYQGFGIRCLDLIRSLEHGLIAAASVNPNAEMDYLELPREDWGKLLELHNGLIEHLGQSPCFMHFPPMDEEQLYSHTSEDVRYFAVMKDGEYIAYLKLAKDGENFATNAKEMVNICGAYCKKEYRGSNIVQQLLNYTMSILISEGFQLIGVDCESFNPTARGFWTKYFKEYTHSLVRRIDEKAIDLIISRKNE